MTEEEFERLFRDFTSDLKGVFEDEGLMEVYETHEQVKTVMVRIREKKKKMENNFYEVVNDMCPDERDCVRDSYTVRKGAIYIQNTAEKVRLTNFIRSHLEWNDGIRNYDSRLDEFVEYLLNNNEKILNGLEPPRSFAVKAEGIPLDKRRGFKKGEWDYYLRYEFSNSNKVHFYTDYSKRAAQIENKRITGRTSQLRKPSDMEEINKDEILKSIACSDPLLKAVELGLDEIRESERIMDDMENAFNDTLGDYLVSNRI